MNLKTLVFIYTGFYFFEVLETIWIFELFSQILVSISDATFRLFLGKTYSTANCFLICRLNVKISTINLPSRSRNRKTGSFKFFRYQSIDYPKHFHNQAISDNCIFHQLHN